MGVNIGPKIGIEGEREYRKAINDLITQQKTFSSEMRELESSFDKNTSAMEKNRKKSDLLNKQIENQSKQVEELEKGLQAATEAYGEDAAETEKWKQAVSNAKTELNKLKKDLENIPSSMQTVGESMQKAGQKMQSVGSAMTKYISGPLAAIGAASIAAFNEVDEGMDIVTKKTGATGEALESLQNSAKSIAETIPTSFATAGEAVGEVNTRFGLTGEELEKLSTQFIEFAELNDTDVSTSIDNVQKLMAAYGVSTEDAGKLLDALNKTGQDTGISMDTLEAAMLKNSSSLKDMGLDAYEAAKFLGNVETSGADTSAVMTGLSKAFVNASKEGKKLPDALKDFEDVMNSSASEQEKLNAACELFGKKAGPAIYDACKQGSLSFESLSNDATDYMGSVQTTFDNVMDPADQFKVALNNVKSAGSDLGDVLLQIAAPAVGEVGNLARSAGEWFGSLTDEQKKTVSYVGIFAAGMGPAITVLGKLTEGAGAVVSALGSIPGAGSALSEIAVPVAVAAAAFLAVKKGIELANEEAIASVEGLQEMIDNTKISVENLETTAEGLQESIDSTNESIQKIKDQAAHAKDLTDELYRLDAITNKTTAQQQKMSEIVAELNGMYPGLALEIDKTTGSINKGKEAVVQYINKAKDMALLEAYTKGINDAYEKLASANVALREAHAQQAEGLNTLYTAYHQYYEALENAPTDVQTGQKLYTDEVQRAETAYYAARDAQMSLNDAVKEAEDTVNNAEDEIKNYSAEMESLGKTTEDTASEQEEQTEEVKDNTEAVKKNTGALKENVKSALDVAKAAAEIIANTKKECDAWDDLYKATYDSISGQIGLFDEWTQEQELTAQQMLQNLQTQTEAYANYAANMEKLSQMAVDSADPNFKALVQSIADMGMDGAGYLQELVNTAETDSELFNDLIAEYGNTEAAKRNAAKITTDVKNEFTSKSKIIAKGFNKNISEIGKSKVFNTLKSSLSNAVSDSQRKTKTWQTNTQTAVTLLANNLKNSVQTGFSALVTSAQSASQKAISNTQERINKMDLKPSVNSIIVPEKATSTAKTTIQTKSSGAKPSIGSIAVSEKATSTAKNTIKTGTSGAKPSISVLNVEPKAKSGAKSDIQKGASGAKPKISSITVEKEAKATAKEAIKTGTTGAKPSIKSIAVEKEAKSTAKESIQKGTSGAKPSISVLNVEPKAKSGAKSDIQKGASGAKPDISAINVDSKATAAAKYNIETQLVGITGSVGSITGGGTAGWNARVDAAGQLSGINGSVGELTGAATAGKNAHKTAQNNFGSVTGSVKLSGAKQAARDAVQIIKNNIPTVYVPVAAKNQSASRPYAEGGFITEEQIALVGEQDKPEVIIPLTASKRSRALDLYQETGEILGVDTAQSMKRTTTRSLPGRSETGTAAGAAQVIDFDKIYSAVAAGAARGMERANVRIYANNREVGRILKDMGVQFA